MMASIEGLDGDGKEGGGEVSARKEEDDSLIVPLAEELSGEGMAALLL